MKTKSKKSIKSNSSKNKKKLESNNKEMQEEQEDNLTLKNNNSKEINTSVSLNSENLTVIKHGKKYDELEPEFRRIEHQNNGIFPITLFESMLRDIDIKDYLIDIISNYLLKKTQKSFMNFELFKEILSLLISEHSTTNRTNKQINTSIFNIISYPKNSIKKSTLIDLFKNDRNFEVKADDFGESKNVKLEEFLELCENKNISFYKSLQNLKYLKYIFFDVDIGNNHSLEFEIITLLLKDRSIADYISERLQYYTNFYLIDIQFWKEWDKLTRNFDE